ncbi:MAG: type II toxin-antitoxin system VapB family antitoxin [Saprospiraceae bacterium]|nr:type II toxin-antitoxin system VapB family antitoxin [Saprospiraceae bacterium]
MEIEITVQSELMKKALALSGLQTPKAVVEEAMKTFVQLLQQQAIRQLRGQLKWGDDLEQMRLDK